MKIYALTQMGRELAKSTSAPKSPTWSVIYFLARRDKADDDTIVNGTGLDKGTVLAVMTTLKRNRFAVELGGGA